VQKQAESRDEQSVKVAVAGGERAPSLLALFADLAEARGDFKFRRR